MSMESLGKLLFVLDVRTLMSVLVWGDLALMVIAVGYCKFHSMSEEKCQLRRFALSKFLQAIAWILLFLRGDISDFFSVILGNFFLYLSFYFESVLMLKMIEKIGKRWFNIQKLILIGTTFLLIIGEVTNDSSHIRIAISSFAIFAMLLLPTLFYLFHAQSSRFRRFQGAFVSIFLVSLIPRTVQSFFMNELSLCTQNAVQSATFLLLTILLFVNGVGFILLMYEKADGLLRELSNLDPLTKIYNRRFFMLKAESYYLRHKGDKKPITMLFLDIDFFKKTNDTQGHLFGDEILKDLAQNLLISIRPIDLCCRYGGEEFVLLLHETSLEQGILVGERIRENIRNANLWNSQYQYTVSIGAFSAIPDSSISLEQMIEKSDQAMYRAKKAGRDCVVGIDLSD